MHGQWPARAHVAAAAVFDGAGRVLIARRPAHLHQGGLWEFPGGKVEEGEPVLEALRRELDEEVGIAVEQARPLIRVRHEYPDKAVLLDVWRVDRFAGGAHGREGQPIAWVAPADLGAYDFPAANAPIVKAVRLPDLCLVTGPFEHSDECLGRLEAALVRGVRLVQLRAKWLEESAYRDLAAQCVRACERHGATLLLNASPRVLAAVGAHGLHLSSTALRACRRRPVPAGLWLSAAVHDADELAQAQRVGVDFVLAGPVQPTATHPGAPTLGWTGLQALTEQARVPVFALGGLTPEHRARAFRHGAQGIAAINALWRGRQR